MGLAPITKNLVVYFYAQKSPWLPSTPLLAVANYLPTLGPQGQSGCSWSPYVIWDQGSRGQPHSIVFALSAPGTVNRWWTEVCTCQSLVVRVSHEYPGLLLRANRESFLLMRLKLPSIIAFFLLSASRTYLNKSMFLHYFSLYIYVDYYITRNSLCCIVCYILLINQTIHLGSEFHILFDAISVVLTLENGSRQFLAEVEERFQWRELALVHFLFVKVHELYWK